MPDLQKFRTAADNLSAKTFRQFPSAELTPESGVINVWLARLDAENTAESEQIMSDDERTRAARFRFETDKKQFIAARAFLRIILGKYLRANPREICFEYNKYGKPSIGGKRRTEIKFNLSHSDNLALFAVTETREIGVDIERVKSSFVDEGMISQCLTRREIEHFLTLSETDRDLFFFDCWTRKEAFLKACGNGLSLPPNEIETLSLSKVSNGFPENSAESSQIFWTSQKLPSISGYAAALAIEGGSLPVRFRQLTAADLS